MAVGVVHNGQLVYSEGFGARNEQGDPVDADTLFEIGSTTKAFTSFAIGQLVDREKLDWGTPVTSLYPVKFKDPIANEYADLTDVLSHRTGLPAHDFLWNSWYTNDEIINKIQYLAPSTQLREAFQYNNNMYTLAGTIAGKVSGLGWENLVAELIFKPLNMSSTFTNPLLMEGTKNHARGFGKDGLVYRYNETFPIESSRPAGAVVSNVNDLAKWLSLINNKGVLANGTQLISRLQFETIVFPHISVELNVPGGGVISNLSYGFGWFIKHYRGKTCIEHSGSTDGYTAQITTFPDLGAGVGSLGIVVLANKHSGPLTIIVANYIADRVLFPEAWSYWSAIWKWFYLKNQWESWWRRQRVLRSRHTGTHPSKPMHQFAGAYRNEAYGDFILRDGGDDSLVGQLQGTPNRPPILRDILVRHWEYDTFGIFEFPKFRYKDARYPALFLNFTVSASGGVKSLAVKLEPAVEEIVFKRV
ncbi:beta-lactamase/transpeptidase-like protein [Chytriomyces sp. MP71]|nr:beta-lactamase/transpeptidase-like protein [Chytriomyces sp. MP71]